MNARIMIPFVFYLVLTGSSWLAGCDTTGPPPPDGQPDTTSHNFTWQTYTLGDGNSSLLYDVAIINDTLAYAVGEIYKKDSLGNWDPNAYNLAKWNGYTWELLRIQFYTICGQSSRTAYPAKAVFAFSATDLWIAMDGDQVARWNGVLQVATVCLPFSFAINKLWGDSPNSLYAVGAGGNIARFDGSRWQKITSGTTLPIQDIWGTTDKKTGEQIVLCVASNRFLNEGKKLLRIQGTTVIQVPDSGLSWSLSSVWLKDGQHYYVCGDGMYYLPTLGPVWTRDTSFPQLYKNRVRGCNENDVVVAGAFGLLSHYNGSTWGHYTGGELPSPNGSFESVDIKGNVIVAVGQINADRAFIVVGKR